MKKLLIGIFALGLIACEKEEVEVEVSKFTEINPYLCKVCNTTVEDPRYLNSTVYIDQRIFLHDYVTSKDFGYAADYNVEISTSGIMLLKTKTDHTGRLVAKIDWPAPYGHPNINLEKDGVYFELNESFNYHTAPIWIARKIN